MPVLDYLFAILEEQSWCMPAHARWNGAFPNPLRCQSDLFASETAAQLGATVNLLGDVFEEFWFHAEVPGNWTPWCCYNLLFAAVCLENNPQKLSDCFHAYLPPVSRFAYHYADDGYCAEGPSYYSKAGGMLFKLTDVMDKMLPGCMDKYYAEPKTRAIFEFITKLRIGNDQVSFGDSQPHQLPLLSLMLPCGERFHSPALLDYGRNQVLHIQSWCGDELCETLTLLFDAPAEFSTEPVKLPAVSTFHDRLSVLRSAHFSATLKGGYNKEPDTSRFTPERSRSSSTPEADFTPNSIFRRSATPSGIRVEADTMRLSSMGLNSRKARNGLFSATRRLRRRGRAWSAISEACDALFGKQGCH